MISSAVSIRLNNHRNLASADALDKGRPEIVDRRSAAAVVGQSSRPFLRIPPFPGCKVSKFTELSGEPADPDLVVKILTRCRVGGCYWGSQPALPRDHVLVRSRGALSRAAEIAGADRVMLWEDAATAAAPAGVPAINGECDAWHMLSGAAALVADAEDEVRVIAALLEVPCYLIDPEGSELVRDTAGFLSLFEDALRATAFENPFSGEPMDVLEAIELCGFWRGLIDSNRDLAGGFGFAFWKQTHVAPLLWGGSLPFQFLRGERDARANGPVALWRAKTPSEVLMKLETQEVPVVEVEDGFLRSRGLGADCIPPLSITVDRTGPYFDPAQPSDLENLLENGEFDEAVIKRARLLRRLLVESGVGKYDSGVSVLHRPAGSRCHILVPGQVEDDRAVIAGGCGLVRNIDLLAAVREQAPDAFILYKPHPDVLAGHRRGAVTEAECLCFADEIVGEASIASLIAMVDEVHVNTSLAGFEALLRDKPVMAYGVPFYAGWGLTHDLGPVPTRRTAKRNVDELVAAALLIYPRYLDPETGLPCPAEVVVKRLSAGGECDPGLFVGLRRLQGKLMRRLRSLVQ